jgi:hypothetical protein
MAGFKQPYLFIKCFFELVENATESFEMLKVVFGEQTVGRIQVYE